MADIASILAGAIRRPGILQPSVPRISLANLAAEQFAPQQPQQQGLAMGAPPAVQAPVFQQQPPQQQQQGGGFLGRLAGLFSGADDPSLTPEQNAAARRNALQEAGLALLATTGNGQNVLANLGGAALGARQNATDYRKDLQTKAALARLMRGGITPESLSKLYTYAVQTGNVQLANSATQMLNALPEAKPEQVKPQVVQTGDAVTQYIPGKGFVNPDYDPRKPEGPDNQHYTESVSRGLSADQLENQALNRELSRARIAESSANREAVMVRSLATGFDRRLKGTVDHMVALKQAQTTLKEAASGNKAAYGSAIANFVQAVDQKAQLRYQMMQWFTKEIDPTVSGRWDILRDRLLKGTYPPSVIAGMKEHIDSLMEDNVKRYNKSRESAVRSHPNLDTYLWTVEDILGGNANVDDSLSGGPAGGGGDPFGDIPIVHEEGGQ